jgi:hypothetical protein
MHDGDAIRPDQYDYDLFGVVEENAVPTSTLLLCGLEDADSKQ